MKIEPRSSSMHNESDLIKRLQEGDEPSFRQFMAQHEKKAYFLAYQLTGNYHDAVELSQEAFTRAYFAIKDFKAKSSLYTWLCRILINLCLRHNENRSRDPKLFFTNDKREAMQNPDAVSEEITSGLETKQSNPAKLLLDKELQLQIDKAIQALSRHQRIVFVLRQVEGLSIEETALAMGCSPGTVKSHLYRAVRKLRKLLFLYLKGEY